MRFRKRPNVALGYAEASHDARIKAHDIPICYGCGGDVLLSRQRGWRDSLRMDDIRHYSDFPPLTADQIRDLAAALRDVFGSNLSREQFSDKLLMFLEDVPGYEFGGASSSLIASAWAAYGGAEE